MTTISRGDVTGLLASLVRADSRNPSLCPDGPGEGQVAALLGDVLRDWGFRVTLDEVAPGRPNVIARIGPTGGRALMFNGHIDVVGVDTMTHAPFGAEISGNRLYGRGSSDMKGGVAAMCAAAARAAGALQCEVIVAGVVDEEYASIGTRALIASGVRADAAIVTEPTRLAIGPAHRGFVWVEITAHGRAAHGSRYDLGVDAIAGMAAVIHELEQLEQTVLVTRTHPLLGRASLHASTIGGGTGWSTYPEQCLLQVERRTLPGEPPDAVLEEMRACCERIAAARPGLRVALHHSLTQAPSDVPESAPVVRALERALAGVGEPRRVEGVTAWTDSALLNEAGIPAICFGPGDMGLAHADEEWIALDEVERATDVLAQLALRWHEVDA